MRVSVGANLDDVKIGFEPVPAAIYTVQIVEEPQVKPKEVDVDGAKETRYYLNMKLRIIDDPEHEGKNLFHSCSMFKDHLGMTTGLKATLQALGAVWDEDGFDTADLVGLSCMVDVTQEMAQKKDEETGKYVQDPDAMPRNRIKSLMSL